MTVSTHVFDATELNFEAEVIRASLTTPVLVDFWAAWCGPCKSLTPILEKVVASYNGAVRLAKVDTDAEMQLAAAFGVRSLPTVVLVKDGQMVDGFMGALPESAVREFLQRHIVANAAEEQKDTAPPPAPAEIEPPERAIARLLYRELTSVADAVRDGRTSCSAAVSDAANALLGSGFDKVEYLTVVDAESLRPVDRVSGPARVVAAVRLGRTRLIDNIGVG